MQLQRPVSFQPLLDQHSGWGLLKYLPCGSNTDWPLFLIRDLPMTGASLSVQEIGTSWPTLSSLARWCNFGVEIRVGRKRLVRGRNAIWWVSGLSWSHCARVCPFSSHVVRRKGMRTPVPGTPEEADPTCPPHPRATGERAEREKQVQATNAEGVQKRDRACWMGWQRRLRWEVTVAGTSPSTDFSKDKHWDVGSGLENATSQLSFQAWALASCGAVLAPY